MRKHAVGRLWSRNIAVGLLLTAAVAVSANAETVRLRIEGEVGFDPGNLVGVGQPFAAVVVYDTSDFMFSAYNPVDFQLSIGSFVVGNPLAGINVEPGVLAPGDSYQVVDQGNPWNGQIAGHNVVGIAINFQDLDETELASFDPGSALLLDLPEWEVKNGTVDLDASPDLEIGIEVTSFEVVSSACPAGVVGYWPLDGDGSESVNGFAGTLVGSASFAAGVVGQALELDGGATAPYLDAGTFQALSTFGGDRMSVAGWFRREPDGPAGDSDGAVITARTFCNEGNFQVYGSLSGGQIYYSKWLDGLEDQIFSGAVSPLATWIHLAVTYSADEVRFYVDGALFSSVTPLPFGGPINDFLQNVQIGFDSCGSYWTGGIDELSVWNVTLTDAEVADIYQRGLNGLPICGDSDRDGVADDLDVCPGTVIPEQVPADRLGVNRWALVDGDGVFDTTPPPGGGKGPGRSFTLEGSAGCSCEQIISALGLGNGHARFGCSTSAMEAWEAIVNP